MGKFKTNDLIVCIEGTEFLVEGKTYRAKSVTIGDDILVWCGGVNKWYADSYFETVTSSRKRKLESILF